MGKTFLRVAGAAGLVGFFGAVAVACGGAVINSDPVPTPCDTCAMPAIACADGSSPYQCGIVEGTCSAVFKGCPPPPAADCLKSDCGPAIRSPSYTCEDGTLGGNTGRCLRDAAGKCAWELKLCPQKCEASECTPIPIPKCMTGTTDARCLRRTDGSCAFDIRCLGAKLACGDARTWPRFSRVCNADKDCATVEHQVDCCGTHQVQGIAATEKVRADAAEASWRPTCPECDCVALPTKDDGGKSSPSGKFEVRCAYGVCTSFAM